jgi:hypothetical protein
MVFDIIVGAILLAFGIIAIYMSIEESKDADIKFLVILLIGIIFAITGGWILVTTITLEVIIRKIVGIGLALFGFFMITGFPDVEEYQSHDMGRAGIIIGLVVLIIGIYLVLF